LRARQTAEGLNLTAVADPLLDECGYGRWSGCSLDDLQAREPEGVAQWLTDPMAAPHGGESIAQLIARVGGWLGDQTGLTGTLVAITHASVIRAAIVHALGADPRAFWRIDIAPLSISMLSGHAGRWNLSAISPPGMFQGPPSVSGAAGN
jgi:broad specificity phosphatase PhoE